ncbi:MAG TPA: family 78 glycoside hydrolase catalytic domain [bacterium]|nr:family 78 glycoside hydrolase catalytic domain [bacterium]
MKTGIKLIGLFAICMSFAVMACVQQAGAAKVTVENLRVEYLSNPLGIDVEHPRFTWVLRSVDRGVNQFAYRILVARTRSNAMNNQGDLWDSGILQSDKSVNVKYAGSSLESGQKYYWKVKVWDATDTPSDWSKIATFQMGLLNRSDWEGTWISNEDTFVTSPLLRKEFRVNKPVRSAYVFIVGLGYYELYFNGEKVGDHVLDPGTTEYDKRVLYETYDVADYLSDGVNAVGAWLGKGYYKHRTTKTYGHRMPLLLQMNITFTDGSTMSVVSDQSWKTDASPILENSIYDGEVYDARMEQPGWCTTAFDDSEWADAVGVEAPGGWLDSQLMPPIKVTKTLRPVAMTNPEEGVYVFDFGQNMTGWPRLFVDGPRGAKVTLRTAEITNRDMAFMQDTAVVGNPELIDTAPNRSAEATDVYILKGAGGTEVYEPRFTYHGYRYVQVEGFPGEPDLKSLEARVVHSAVPHTGRFESSNTLFNQIHENILWGQVSNLHSKPTDCPQRDERAGWMGDAHLTAEEAMHNFDMAAFYTNWLEDIKDAQQDSGFVPDVVPHHGKYPIKGTPAWQAAYPLVTWYMYKYHDDVRILEEHYQPLADWLQYMGWTANNHIIEWGRGDWVPPETAYSPIDDSEWLTSTAYYYEGAVIQAKMAEILGKSGDVDKYQQLAEDIKDAFNDRFFNASTNQYGTGSQTSNAFPLYLDMIPEGHNQAVLQHLVDNVMQEHNGHLTTGILGTKALVEALPEYGRNEVMYTIANQTTFPGWGYMICRGATTLWERWGGYRYFGPAMNSLNHIMFGSVDEFFYRNIAGVDMASPGFKDIIIKPNILGDMTSAKGHIATVHGPVTAKWSKQGNSVTLFVAIPGNTSATVYVPTLGMQNVQVTENGAPVWQEGSYVEGVPGITGATVDGDYIAIKAGSGTYQFHTAN